jgi:phage shock protein PspC (stress-responsive transcriptional regulator)
VRPGAESGLPLMTTGTRAFTLVAMEAPPAPVSEPPTEAPSSGQGESQAPSWSQGLYRIRQDGLLGGVCAGLAARLGLRPSIVRVAFVAATALGGLGAIVYFALWLALPDVDAAATPVSRLRIVLAVGLAVFGAALLLTWMPMPPPELLWPGLLVGIGAALWQPDAQRSRWTPPARPPAPDAAARPSPEAPAVAPSPPAPREPQILGRVTVAVALAAVGVGLIFDRTELFDIAAYQLLAVVLLVLGAGLVVGAFLGRARWLLLLAVPLVVVLPLAGTFAALDVDPLHHLGERDWSAPTASAVEPLYENGTGASELVIGDGRPDSTSGATTIRNGIGNIVVTVPPGMAVHLHGQTGWGTIRVIDERVEVIDTPDGEMSWYSDRELIHRQGRDEELDYVLEGEPGGGSLTVDAVIGLGDIEVVRMAPTRQIEGR